MTRRDVLMTLIGVPSVGMAAPNPAGFTFTAPLALDAFVGQDDALMVGEKVTLIIHDPILLDHARDCVERRVELSLTPVD